MKEGFCMAFLAKDILEIYKILINNKKGDIDIKDLFNMVSDEVEKNKDFYDLRYLKNISFDNNFAMFDEVFEFDEVNDLFKNYDDIDFSLIKRFLN